MKNKKLSKKAEKIGRWLIMPIPMLVLILFQLISTIFVTIGIVIWMFIKLPKQWGLIIVDAFRRINDGNK